MRKQTKIKKDTLYPLATTIVDPSEYNIEEMMIRMVKRSNTNMECYTAMDIGKIIGLYIDWKYQKDIIEDQRDELKTARRLMRREEGE
jgi:hypothetical protein